MTILDNMNVNRPHATNVFDVYSINANNKELGNLYIEAIKLDNSKSWNQSPGSAFDSFLKKELHSHKFEYISSFEDNFCSLRKYTIDHNFDIGIIWFSLNSYELFIFDQQGKLFNDLLTMYSVNNEKLIILEKAHDNLAVTKSLTQDNLLENYF